MMKDAEKRILVAMGIGQAPGDRPTVILGISETCWQDMAAGIAKDVDLVPLGIPAQILVMRGKDNEDIERQLREAAGALKIPMGGMKDLSVKEPSKQ